MGRAYKQVSIQYNHNEVIRWHTRRRMLKAKMVTVSTQTDVDENAKMSTEVDSTSSQVVSKPCWCRSAKILDMQLFRKAVYVDQDQGKEAMIALSVAT